MDEKYIVFKRDEYEQWGGGNTRREGGYPPPKLVEDAVVIRTQDIFAAGGLSAYSHQIRTLLNSGRLLMGDEKRRELEKVADYFDSVAQEAEHRLAMGECKLPD